MKLLEETCGLAAALRNFAALLCERVEVFIEPDSGRPFGITVSAND